MNKSSNNKTSPMPSRKAEKENVELSRPDSGFKGFSGSLFGQSSNSSVRSSANFNYGQSYASVASKSLNCSSDKLVTTEATIPGNHDSIYDQSSKLREAPKDDELYMHDIYDQPMQGGSKASKSSLDKQSLTNSNIKPHQDSGNLKRSGNSRGCNQHIIDEEELKSHNKNINDYKVNPQNPEKGKWHPPGSLPTIEKIIHTRIEDKDIVLTVITLDDDCSELDKEVEEIYIKKWGNDKTKEVPYTLKRCKTFTYYKDTGYIYEKDMETEWKIKYKDGRPQLWHLVSRPFP